MTATSYSKTAADNTTLNGLTVTDGTAPSAVDDLVRNLMADIAELIDGTTSFTSPAFTTATVAGDVDLDSVDEDGANDFNNVNFVSNRTTADAFMGGLEAYWGGSSTAGNLVARMAFESGNDTVNKDDGIITFWTTPSGGSITEALRIDQQQALTVTGDIVASADVSIGSGLLSVGTTSQINSSMLTIQGTMASPSNIDLGFAAGIALQDEVGNQAFITIEDAGNFFLYAGDGEVIVTDSAGNNTTVSPHNFSLIPGGPSEEMAWSYYSERNGKAVNIDMMKLARLVEGLTGEKLVYIEDVE